MGMGPRAQLAARCASILLLAATVPPALQTSVSPAYADGPTIVVTPDSNLPHALESVYGSGFQPLTPVSFSLTSSMGVTQLSTLNADGAGSVNGLLRLPFSIDAGTANTI